MSEHTYEKAIAKAWSAAECGDEPGVAAWLSIAAELRHASSDAAVVVNTQLRASRESMLAAGRRLLDEEFSGAKEEATLKDKLIAAIGCVGDEVDGILCGSAVMDELRTHGSYRVTYNVLMHDRDAGNVVKPDAVVLGIPVWVIAHYAPDRFDLVNLKTAEEALQSSGRLPANKEATCHDS